jgi:acyl dehydratase
VPYLEDQEPGGTTTTASRTLSEQNIEAFAQLSGDRHPIHTDAAYAKQRGHDDIIAHALLVLTVAQGLTGGSGIFGDGALAFLALTWRMIEAVYPGDTLNVHATVQSQSESCKDPSRGIVEFAFRVFNQRGRQGGRRLGAVIRQTPPQT